ncbi:MAG: hypothetical protein KDE14_02900 [Rhodobacteraceae bacterium]|nr:hypothetical protein [Paracoccaceae bacterium]
MLGPIVAVTMTVADLGPIEDAYSKYLGYRVVERGEVSADLAAVWGATKVAGQPYMIMQPESGADCYLRFIAVAPYPDYKPFHTYGWNSTELLVTDVDAVNEKLKDSPFEVIGPPRALSSNDDIKAMQVMGPEQEILYLTRIKDENYGLGVAKSFVDRPFIVINGGRDMAELIRFYSDVMGDKVDKPIPVRLSALNRLRGLDLEMRHPLSTVNIGGPFKIEIDQYPEGTADRPVREGELPPGTAMVAFEVPKLDDVPVAFVGGTLVTQSRPYNGRRVAVIKGPSGELHELIETAP